MQEWLDAFPLCKLVNAVSDRSDRSPIHIQLYNKERRQSRRRFRFENAWLEEPDIDTVVNAGWENSVSDELLMRLQNCTEEKNKCGKSLRSRYRVAIDICEESLKK